MEEINSHCSECVVKYLTSGINKHILVGAGAGGAVVAARLSEDPSIRVLLLEAGPAEYPDSDVPANYGMLQLSEIDWQFKTEPQTYCCGSFINRVRKSSNGKTVHS